MKTILLFAFMFCVSTFAADDALLAQVVKMEDRLQEAQAKQDKDGINVFSQQLDGLKRRGNVTAKEIADYRARQTAAATPAPAVAKEPEEKRDGIPFKMNDGKMYYVRRYNSQAVDNDLRFFVETTDGQSLTLEATQIKTINNKAPGTYHPSRVNALKEIASRDAIYKEHPELQADLDYQNYKTDRAATMSRLRLTEKDVTEFAAEQKASDETRKAAPAIPSRKALALWNDADRTEKQNEKLAAQWRANAVKLCPNIAAAKASLDAGMDFLRNNDFGRAKEKFAEANALAPNITDLTSDVALTALWQQMDRAKAAKKATDAAQQPRVGRSFE